MEKRHRSWKHLFAALIVLLLGLWSIHGEMMMCGFPQAFALGDRMQEVSGLGRWFPLLYLFAAPVLLVGAK